MAAGDDWGKAHENNSISFGAASDTSNGFGSIYEGSYSGDTVILGGKGPTNEIAPAITGTPERGEILTCSTGTWTGTGTITYAYQWLRGGTPISGATTNTYTLVAADDNQQIRCEVTATDSEGSRSKDSNSVLALGAPFNLSAPVLSGTEQVGETLSVTDGTWQGVTPITYAYKWFRNGIEISGETLSAYTLVAADYGATIYAQVIASNSISTTTVDSNSTGAIAGTTPIISGVPTISGTENVAEVLTATPASVSGVPTPSNSYQWQRSADGLTGWANITGATSSTYTLVLADENNYIRVIQTSSNVVGSDDAVSGSTGQIGPEQLFDPDYQAVLDYATTEGYTLPSAGQQTLQNQLVVDLKSAGVWAKMQSFSFMPTDGDSNFALVNWKRLITMSSVNSPTFTTNVGFSGDGTSSYIDTLDQVTLLNNTTDITVGYWSSTGTNGSLHAMIGAINSSGGVQIIPNLATSTRFFLACNTNFTFINGTGLLPNQDTELISITNDGANNTVLKRNNVTLGSPSGTFSTYSGNLYLLARNFNGSANSPALATINSHFVADRLTDAELLAFRNAINTYLTLI